MGVMFLLKFFATENNKPSGTQAGDVRSLPKRVRELPCDSASTLAARSIVPDSKCAISSTLEQGDFTIPQQSALASSLVPPAASTRTAAKPQICRLTQNHRWLHADSRTEGRKTSLVACSWLMLHADRMSRGPADDVVVSWLLGKVQAPPNSVL